MAFYKISDPGSKNQWRSNIGRAVSERAQVRKCPKCNRLDAVSERRDPDTAVWETWCKYSRRGMCDYSRTFRFSEPQFDYCRWEPRHRA